MAYNGHVSRKNAKALHSAGIRVTDLPSAKSYKQWARQNKPSDVPILGPVLGAVGL